jgi:hypothetical protein
MKESQAASGVSMFGTGCAALECSGEHLFDVHRIKLVVMIAELTVDPYLTLLGQNVVYFTLS